VSVVTAVGGVVCWLLQGFDGMRLASLRWGSETAGVEVLAALLIASGLTFAAVHHEHIALKMDCTAANLHRAGLERAPLWLWSGAAVVDASEPVYALRAASAHREIGNEFEAECIERDLTRRWDAYRREIVTVEEPLAVLAEEPVVVAAESDDDAPHPVMRESRASGSTPAAPTTSEVSSRGK
jgi:hypothetical protein